ncbi:aquaporin NIP2-1-like protein [Tanacetum coccineum]
MTPITWQTKYSPSETPSQGTGYRALIQSAVAEIVTTFLLVFVTCGAAALSTKDDHKVPQLRALVASRLIMTIMIYVRHIFSAHMNPAVTLAIGSVSEGLWVAVRIWSLTMPDQRNGSVNYFILAHRSWEGKHAHCIPLALCLMFVLHYEKRSSTNN